MKSKISKFYNLRWPKFLAIFLFFLLFGAYTQIFAVFAPGSTLDPNCAPGSTDCRVEDNKWDILSNSIHLSDGHVGIDNPNPSVSLDVTGDIEYTGSITDISDERLKENIIPITGALNKVLGIKGKYYNMKETPGKLETGFIAQNVQEYVPTAVSVVDPVNGYLGVSYPALIPVAFGAIQELDQKLDQNVNNLSDKLSSLSLKIETLSSGSMETATLNSLIKNFLGDTMNNLDLVFFGEVRAKKLCLDDLCFTKDELKKILDHVNTLAPVNTGTTTDNTNNNTNSNTDDNTNNTNIGNQNGNANGGEGDTNTNGNQNNTNGNGALDNNDKTGGSETENGNSNNGNNSNNENSGNGNGNSDKKS